ncbi:serine hydrolase domain-containing protein [Actinomadura sp. DC4]|uniref:serine hydrolase domain-containing protein n=1 Tax=Actinomadura sp. DC4 TaxID=3055069 RepID=UPI0025B151D9|nr:serine hydrolase domain-containing protein [Actinomadura sp. DC4]MDN3352822.1 serine hydrolase domain-containing protein [Actinomadura sp. DC4]
MRYVRVVGGALALAVAAGVAASPRATAATERPGLRQVLQRLTGEDGAPGAFAEVEDRTGRAVLTSGVGDLKTGAPIPGDGRFRIGSMTKPYVATVVLQLVGEHRVALDAPIERYLPGLVRGNGNDGREITVREMLQHTSGLPDYLIYLSFPDLIAHPYAHYDRSALLSLALGHPALFRPGKGWSYSNTDYLLAGLLIEKVTGHPYGEEIRRRILTPLGLRATSVPGDRTTIPGPHARGYVRPDNGTPVVEMTEFNPSVAAGSGDMISSGADMSRFFDALLHGRLLRPAQLREMMTTRATGGADGRAYGLGLESRSLPCGGVYWGHGGDIFGFETLGGATVDGRRATVMVNLDPGGTDAQDADATAAIGAALCDGPAGYSASSTGRF